MRDRTVWRPALVVIAALVVALAGCTAIENSHARNKEQLLAAAGFHERPADTPDKLKQLESLPDGPEVEQLRQELARYPRRCALTLLVWAAAVGLAKLGFARARRRAAPPSGAEAQAPGAPEEDGRPRADGDPAAAMESPPPGSRADR